MRQETNMKVINMKTQQILLMGLTAMSVLSGCSSNRSILPDQGPTTMEVYDQHMAGGGSQVNNTFKRDRKGNLIRPTQDANQEGNTNKFGGSPWTSASGDRIMPLNTGKSALAAREMDALQRDFRRIQNPEVIGYVYPHLSGNEHPVPGYFTAFNLYTADHYAQSGDEGQMQTIRRLTP